MNFRNMVIFIAVACAVGAAQQTSDQSGENIRRDKLAKHAKLFAWHGGKPFSQRNPAPDGSIDLSIDNLYLYASDPTAGPPPNQLRQLLSRFKVVVIAIAEEQTSALTPSQSFIYSDWDFKVTKVMKNVSVLPADAGSLITVTRTGGTLDINGQKLVARDANFPDFTKQHTYLLGLSPLPESSSFLAGSEGSFDLSGATVTYLDDPRHQTEVRDYVKSKKPSEFIAEIESMRL